MNNVIFTTAKIFRNVKDYKFALKLDAEKQEEITKKLQDILSDFELVNLQNITAENLKFLKENFMFKQNLKTLFLNKEKNVCIYLFDTEHITIVSTDQDNVENAYKNVKQVAENLSNKISLSYSDEFGYLMSDLTHIGSGLKLESEICLSCVEEIGKIEQVKQNVKKLGYSLTETKNAHIYKLSSTCNLGVVEKEILTNYQKMLNHLQEVEVESVKMLSVSNHDEILDKAMRSYAILNGAYLMTYAELNAHLINIITALNIDNLDVEVKVIKRLQKLSRDENSEYISQSELKNIANKVKQVLKGENDV